MKSWVTWFAMVALAGCSSNAQQATTRIGVFDLASQRVSGETTVFEPGRQIDDNLFVLVTINVHGDVIDAQPSVEDQPTPDPTLGVAAVKQWHFRPQQLDGRPVEAIGKVPVTYSTLKVAAKAVPFPVGDPDKVVMTLERHPCLGACPTYNVTVSGTGEVHFSAELDTRPDSGDIQGRFKGAFSNRGVLWRGEHTARIAPDAARQLIERFRQVGFLELKDEYRSTVTDNPTKVLKFTAPGVNKTVVDYVGETVGMPHDVVLLENEIDRMAGTVRWIDGTPETLLLLEAEGFDARSPDGVNFAVKVADRLRFWPINGAAKAELLALLVDRGLPLQAPVTLADGTQSTPNRTLGDQLLMAAVDGRSMALFDKLQDRGVLDRADKALLTTILHAGAGCFPAMAQALVKAGADAQHPPATKSALFALRDDSGGVCRERSVQEIADMAETLLALGVPVDARDDQGASVLIGVDAPMLARVLLRHHADPNARDKDGETPLLATWDDRVALLLLNAGADPKVRDEQGTVRDHTLKRHMPATLAWLDAHNIR